ncbi:hypothetical protein GQ42DRAFT_158925, partial [Ramicandelaber brevisporus]
MPTDSATRYDTDVLIVGGGPTAQTLAINLRRLGVDCRVLDKSAEPTQTSRAFAFQPRTLELLSALGITAALEAAGGKYRNGLSIIRGTASAPFVSYDAIPSRQQNLMMLEQDIIERVLLKQLSAMGIDVERSAAVTDFTADADGVTATVVRNAKSSEVFDWFASNHAYSDIAVDLEPAGCSSATATATATASDSGLPSPDCGEESQIRA